MPDLKKHHQMKEGESPAFIPEEIEPHRRRRLELREFIRLKDKILRNDREMDARIREQQDEIARQKEKYRKTHG